MANLTGKITKTLAVLSLISLLSAKETGTAEREGKDNFYSIIVPERKKDMRKVVVVHAGHGLGNDYKHIWKFDRGEALYRDSKKDTTYYESDITMHYVNNIKKKVEEEYGDKIRVELSRESDEFPIPLEYRIYFANEINADLSIDIHVNNFFLNKKKKIRDKKIKGFTVYYWNKKDKELAKIIEKNLKVLPTKSRGVVREKYNILKYAKVPAVLIEVGYLPRDKGYITDTIPDVENAIVKSIDDYFEKYAKKDSIKLVNRR